MAFTNQQSYQTSQPQGNSYYYDSNQAGGYSQQPMMYQPYQTYPIAAPQTTVFVYDDTETTTQRRNGKWFVSCLVCILFVLLGFTSLADVLNR
jgi:hypothetical protein